jgi:fructose-1-phosphate kinase PfkB-like protein
VTAAGKAVNVARALKTLGTPPLVIGFCGDPALDPLLKKERLPFAFVPVSQPTRTCVTVVERKSRRVTELVEEAATPSLSDWRKLKRLIARTLPAVRMVIVSGNLPSGFPVGFYAWVARAAQRKGVPLILDSHGAPMRRALRHPLLLAKMNAEEFSTSRLPARRRNDVLVTDGARGAVLWASDGKKQKYRASKIRALNPIGSGDAVSAGLAHMLLRGHSMDIAVRFGMACGAANALTLTPGTIRLKDVRRFFAVR